METVDFVLKSQVEAINTLQTDYLGEFIAASMISAGIPADKTLLMRGQGDKKYIAKDISKIEFDYSFTDMIEYLYIYTNRQGLYDALPEGVFHGLRSTDSLRSKEDIIHEIRRHRDKELFARKFFQPFEMVFDKLLVAVQEYELKFDRAYMHTDLKEIFEEHWELFRLLDIKQALLFLRIIPIIPEISLDMSLAETVLSIILGVEVSVNEDTKFRRVSRDSGECIKLNRWKLGYNSTSGNTVKDEYPNLIVTIGPISPKEMKSFEGGQQNNMILNTLTDMILPFGRNIEIKYQINKEESKFRLSDKTHKTYLGINTTL